VLDPFMGSGSTAVAAVRTGRHFAGYDTDAAYVKAARARVAAAEEGAAPAALGAREWARQALDAAGFADVRPDVTVAPGVSVTFEARDRTGGPWYVEVAGPATSLRPGLRRADVVWRTAGKAAAVQAARSDVPFLVLTPARPGEASVVDAPLAALTGPGHPVHDVVVLSSDADLSRLAAYGRDGWPSR
jgi:hypothetical protein